MLTAGIDSIDRDIALLIAEELSPAARSTRFAELAQIVLDDTDRTQVAVLGRLPGSTTYVDGIAGAALSAVKPDGVIVREYQLAFGALEEIREELRRLSPRLTGRYAGSHVLFADGVEVPENEPVPAAERYVFASNVPYARKLERIHEIYQQVTRWAGRQFGNSVSVKYSQEAVPGGDLAQWARKTRMSHRGHATAATREHWLSRQPAIIITPR